MKSELSNRPMKFWEVMSAFREHETILWSVFSHPDWRSPYLDWYILRNKIVNEQDRDILDSLVPLKLTNQIAEQVSGTYYFDITTRNLWANQPNMSNPTNIQELTVLEVHNRFGGAFIEEVKEYGSAKVPKFR